MHHWPGAGLSIAGDSWGDPDGPLVVLLHGGGQTRHVWKGTGQRLAGAGYHAIAFDARGHGDSDWAPDGLYTQDAMVADLEAVLAAVGQPRPVLVGASMGGGTSLVAAGEGHVDATALVLVDVAPRIEPEGVARIHAFMSQKPDGFDSLEEVAEAIGAYQPHRAAPRPGRPGQKRPDRRRRKVLLDWDPKSRVRGSDFELREVRLEKCARNLTLPTLLVRGGLSDILSEEGAEEFLRLCPHSEYVNVTGAAHMVAGDRNDVFGTAVVDFWPVRPGGRTTSASSVGPAGPARWATQRHRRHPVSPPASGPNAMPVYRLNSPISDTFSRVLKCR